MARLVRHGKHGVEEPGRTVFEGRGACVTRTRAHGHGMVGLEGSDARRVGPEHRAGRGAERVGRGGGALALGRLPGAPGVGVHARALLDKVGRQAARLVVAADEVAGHAAVDVAREVHVREAPEGVDGRAGVRARELGGEQALEEARGLALEVKAGRRTGLPPVKGEHVVI